MRGSRVSTSTRDEERWHEHTGSPSCSAGAGDKVCVWTRYQTTAYTVKATECYYFNGAASQCRDLGQYTIFSPNNCQDNVLYCVRGDACRTESQGYYVTDGAAAGGPPC